ncbi:DUF6377 domain-containing protein [Bacteroides sp. OttesenSCG-928-F21]|nr:DUF6377 domain-containing protein [Bacteroides sp. OttesenSCG-928-F21]
MTDYLDYLIANKEQFTEQKEAKIESLQKLLEIEDSSLEYTYEINLKLYNEYRKFKLDSAIHYGQENVYLAEILNNDNLKYQSKLNLASAYSYAGKSIESQEILKTIDSRQLSNELLADYYETYSRFYAHYAVVSNRNYYYNKMELYRDSLLSILDPASFNYKINQVSKYVSLRETEKAHELLNELLQLENADTPEYAMITHFLGSIYGMKGDIQLAKKYCILSAIADIKNSIKENASFQRLSSIYYDSGDITRAFLYAQSAIEDAVFSGVQFRTAEMSKLYSIINASYQTKEAKTNSKLRTYLMLISILSFFLILLVLYVLKQMRKLSRIKEELSESNEKLLELNEEVSQKNELLNDVNGLLLESNDIKEQYIAQFFDLCSTYIDKMEDYRKTLYKLAINRQMESLMKRLKSTSGVENELEELYYHFDRIFLNLYPTFIEEFNALLAEDEKIILKSKGLLNRELRIFALLRLGITDNAKISAFLRCSMSTIYNYRTKMRNKLGENRDDFELLLMKIGKVRTKTD